MKNSPRIIQGSLRKDPFLEPRLPIPGPNRLRQMTASGPVDASLMGVMGQYLSYVSQSPKVKSLNQTKRCQNGPFVDKWSVDWQVIGGLSSTQVYCKLKGELLNSPNVQIRERAVTYGYFRCFKWVLTPKFLYEFILPNQNPKSLRNSLELH